MVFEGAALSYAEFDERMNRLARYLISCGVGPESRVALAMRRSLDLVVGMYAVVKAGGAYVPVDPDHPADRIGYVLDSAQPVCVLSTSADRGDLPGTFAVLDIDDLDLSRFGSNPITDATGFLRCVRSTPRMSSIRRGRRGGRRVWRLRMLRS